MKKLLSLLFVLGLALSACGTSQTQSAPTETFIPSATLAPTQTPTLTSTPVPTFTPTPTSTPVPSPMITISDECWATLNSEVLPMMLFTHCVADENYDKFLFGPESLSILKEEFAGDYRFPSWGLPGGQTYWTFDGAAAKNLTEIFVVTSDGAIVRIFFEVDSTENQGVEIFKFPE